MQEMYSGLPVCLCHANETSRTDESCSTGFGRGDLLSGTIWICLSCETCNTRCPQDINILRVIDGLREMSNELDYYNPYPALPALHQIFMAFVKRFGKVYELGLALLINLRMLTPFKDIDMASPMFLKGKLKPFPHRSHGAKELRQVMARISKLEKASSH